MDTRNSTQGRSNSAQYAWTGFAAGIACMAVLVACGLLKDSAGMVAMGSSMGAMLGAARASTSAAGRRKARAQA